MRLVAIILSNGAMSLVSLMATVLVGRQDGPTQLGVFGVSFAVLSLAQLFAREVGLNRALSSPWDLSQRQVAYSRALLVALITAIPTAIAGTALANPVIAAMGVVIPGYVMFTFLRLLTMTDGRVSRGFTADAVLLGAVALASGVVVAVDMTSLVVLITWALALPVSCSVLQRTLGLKLRPGWYLSSSHHAGVGFGVQSLVGAGSVHLSTFLLAGLFGPVLVGALRGASTLMGPVNVLTSSIATFAIRQLAVASEARRLRTMLVWLLMSTGLAAAGAAATWIVMVQFGSLILGESWVVVEPLVPWVSLDAALVAVTVAARAAHRVDQRGKAALKIGIILGANRLLFLPLGGVWAGATGVAMALAFTSLMSAVLWWLSYIIYRQRSGSGAN